MKQPYTLTGDRKIMNMQKLGIVSSSMNLALPSESVIDTVGYIGRSIHYAHLISIKTSWKVDSKTVAFILYQSVTIVSGTIS